MQQFANPSLKDIARHVSQAFGGLPKVHRFHHDIEDVWIDLLSCADRPCYGVTSFCTLGLSQCNLVDEEGTVFPARIELMAACASSAKEFPNVLVACGLSSIRSNRIVRVGTCMANFVCEYFPKTTVPHMYATNPFLWENYLSSFSSCGSEVMGVMLVPISEKERKHLHKSGGEALESLFEANQVDVFDLQRRSVV